MGIKTYFVDAIVEQLNKCNDISFLSLILTLLEKSNKEKSGQTATA